MPSFFVAIVTWLLLAVAQQSLETEIRETTTSSRRTVASYLKGTKTKHGPYKEYDLKTGAEVEGGFFDQGNKHGLWTSSGSDGAKLFETPFVNGKVDGVKVQFGKRYKAPLSTVVIDPAVKVAETTYVAGLKHGPAREWLSDGTQQKESAYLLDELHGPIRSWFINGQLAHEGQYLFGQRYGEFRHWEPNGKQNPSTYHVLGDEGSGKTEASLERWIEFAARQYAGWVYGSDASKRQVDCTQFVEAAVLEAWGAGLDSAVKRALHQRILMTDLGGLTSEDLRKSIVSRDARTKGVQQALVNAGLGTAVSVGELAPGDLVQYWTIGGSPSGHTAIVLRVTRKDGKTTASLFGAHKSKGGVGVLDGVSMDDAEGKRIVYAVRPTRR